MSQQQATMSGNNSQIPPKKHSWVKHPPPSSKEDNGNGTNGDVASMKNPTNDEQAIFPAVTSSASVLLADKLKQRLEESFAANVQNLPMLRDPEPLLKRLRASYFPQVLSTLEYCQERIFALAPFLSAKRREKVLQLLPKYKTAKDIDVPTKHAQQKILDQKRASFGGKDTRKKEDSNHVKDTADVTNLQQQLVDLRDALQQAKRKRKELQDRLEDLKTAHAIGQKVTQTNVASFPNSMKIVATEASSLQQCEKKGQDYINHKKRLQEESEDNEENNNPFAYDLALAAKRKRAKMTLEERYQEDFQCSQPPTTSIQDMKDAPHARLLVVESASSSD